IFSATRSTSMISVPSPMITLVFVTFLDSLLHVLALLYSGYFQFQSLIVHFACRLKIPVLKMVVTCKHVCMVRIWVPFYNTIGIQTVFWIKPEAIAAELEIVSILLSQQKRISCYSPGFLANLLVGVWRKPEYSIDVIAYEFPKLPGRGGNPYEAFLRLEDDAMMSDQLIDELFVTQSNIRITETFLVAKY